MEQELLTILKHPSSPPVFICLSGVSVVHVVKLHVFTFVVPCFDVRYDFRVKMMFDSSWLLCQWKPHEHFFLKIVYLYLYCRWRSIYEKREGGDPINKFNLATAFCMSHTRTWIFNIICRGLYYMFVDLRWEAIVCFVDIGGIVDRHC